jgi:DNA mismatch repair ATPase MutS
MNVHLMYRDRDFHLQEQAPAWHRHGDSKPRPKLLPNEDALIQDLELNTVFNAMAGGDEYLFQVAREAILSGLQNDVETILYRQAVLKDCLEHEPVVRTLYDLAVEAIERKRRRWLSLSSSSPSSILYEAGELLQIFTDVLARLKGVADERADEFESEGFKTFFEMLQRELADDYLAAVKARLKELKFRGGVLMSAELGNGNQGAHYVLRQSPRGKPGWIQRIVSWKPSAYTYRIAERDEAGARALSEMRNRGINLVANAAAQSADHMLSFFTLLRAELAFYLGCVNLHRQLAQRAAPVCFPVPAPPGAPAHSCVGLRDVGLVLSMERGAVGNDLDANGKKLVIITGANQGGKSTFLRGVGVAQLMMQSGLFVAAESFTADICRGLFTHYKREEDATMKSGKFDEELKRMSEIADALTPDSMLLFNESFAATNEREGSEIARQIIRALLETRVKIFFVTHMYEFAHDLDGDKTDSVLFLRAERHADGTRTFKLLPGEPLETSFGVDLYKEIFADAVEKTPTG